jgi:hypothetical protein
VKIEKPKSQWQIWEKKEASFSRYILARQVVDKII